MMLLWCVCTVHNAFRRNRRYYVFLFRCNSNIHWRRGCYHSRWVADSTSHDEQVLNSVESSSLLHPYKRWDDFVQRLLLWNNRIILFVFKKTVLKKLPRWQRDIVLLFLLWIFGKWHTWHTKAEYIVVCWSTTKNYKRAPIDETAFSLTAQWHVIGIFILTRIEWTMLDLNENVEFP